MGKNRFYVLLASIICLIALAMISCGPKYPDISGDWEITAHSCIPEQVGMIFTVTQDGPDIILTMTMGEMEIEFEGTINENGYIELEGDVGEIHQTITGVYDGESILTLVAEFDSTACAIKAERQ